MSGYVELTMTYTPMCARCGWEGREDIDAQNAQRKADAHKCDDEARADFQSGA